MSSDTRYGLIGKMISIPGRRDDLASILLEGIVGMPGCDSYIVANDDSDENALWITEVWESQASHQESLQLPSVQQAIARGKPLIAGFGERFETQPLGGTGITDSSDSVADQRVGFSWVTPVLCVSDMIASLDHYEKVLGFEIAWQWSESEAFEGPEKPTFACVCRGEISLFLCEQGQGNPGSWLSLNLRTLDELEQIHKEYLKAGASIIEEPQDCSWGMREMWVEDPDGNTFRIGSPLDEG